MAPNQTTAPKADTRQAAADHTNRGREWGLLALALGLWFVSTFFLFGDLGRWLDDYAWTHRDPVTRTFEWGNVFTLPHGSWWRLLMNVLVINAQTLLWDAPWANHLICAIAHGCVSAAVYGLARSWRIGRGASVGAGLAFLCAPIGYEGIFWPAAVGVLFGTLTLVLIARRISLMAHADDHPSFGPSWRTWLGLAVASASMPLWYEQPTAMLAAIPILGLWCTRSMAGLVERIRRAAALALVCGVPSGLMLVVVAVGKSDGDRGSSSSLISASELGDKAALIFDQAARHLSMEEFWRGALTEGWSTITGPAWPVSVIAGLVIVVAAAGSARGWLGDDMHSAGLSRRESESALAVKQSGAAVAPGGRWGEWGGWGGWRDIRGGAILFSAAAFLLAWLPLVVVKMQWTASRLCYAPLTLLALILALGLDVLMRPRAAQRGEGGVAGGPLGVRPAWVQVVRIATGVVLLAWCIGGSIALVGVQSALRKRFIADERQAAQLVELLPNPPRHAVVIPVVIRDRVVSTGDARFDSFAWGVWELGWSANARVQQAYRRTDVFALGGNRWVGPEVARATAEGIEMAPGRWVPARYGTRAGGGSLIPWDRVLPVRIVPLGTLLAVQRVVIERPDNADIVIDLPHMAASSVADDLGAPGTAPTPKGKRRAGRPWVLADDSGSELLEQVEQWTWTGSSGGKPVAFVQRRLWDTLRRGIELHPEVPSIVGRSSIETVLPAWTGTRTMHFRAAMPERNAAPKDGSDGAIVIVERIDTASATAVEADARDAGPSSKALAGAAVEVARVRIEPLELRTTWRWVAVSAPIRGVAIAESKGERTIRVRIRVEPGSAGNPDYDTVVVSQPVISNAE